MPWPSGNSRNLEPFNFMRHDDEDIIGAVLFKVLLLALMALYCLIELTK